MDFSQRQLDSDFINDNEMIMMMIMIKRVRITKANTFLDFPGILVSLLSSALKMFFYRCAETTSPTFYSICCLHFKVI